MKSITMTVFSRQHYAVKVIESVKECDTYGYHLFISIDPGHPDVIEACRKAANFIPTSVRVNPSVLGAVGNTKCAYDWAFEAGSELNVALEEDTPVSPDAIDLANWFYGLSDLQAYSHMNLFSHSRTLVNPLSVVECSDFCPWAWCVTRRCYSEWVDPCWMSNPKGWDWSMDTSMRAKGLKALRPVLSRSGNIGRNGGLFYSPELHEQHFSGHVASSQLRGTVGYYIDKLP